MTPMVPVFNGVGVIGVLDDLHLAIDRKFREPFERQYKQMGLQLLGSVTTYGTDDIVYSTDEVSLNVDGYTYSLGFPTDVFDLLTEIKELDIGWWYLDALGFINVRGFHNYGDFTQNGTAVCSPDTFTPNTDTPTIADIVRELALKIGPNAAPISSVAWVYNGNTVATGTWIGTINSEDFPLRANSVEAMRIFATGASVGIGITATPLGKLHVQGTAGQSPLYVVSGTGSHTWENRDDGSIYRDGEIFAIKWGTGTSWGRGAGLAIVNQDHNSLFGYQSGDGLIPDGIGGGANNTFIGAGSGRTQITGTDCTILGFNADLSGATNLVGSIALGSRAMITASNQMVVGSTLMPITNMYFGSGVASSSPSLLTIHGTNATGANVASQTITFAIGQGRGNAVAAEWWFQVTKTGSIGSTVQPLYTVLKLGSTGASLLPHDTTAGSTYELRFLELAAGGVNYIGFKASDALAGNVIWTLPIADSTGTQALVSNGSGILSWATVTPSGSAWLLDGNTVGGVKWIGTIDNFDFPIRTNSVENARVFTTGQTGFGITASPLGKVHIKGIAAGYALYTEFNATTTQNWSIRDNGELRYAAGRAAFINASAPSQTYFGYNAGINMSDGNTGFGAFVFSGTGAGIENVAMGGNAALGVTSGSGNVFYGYNSGNAITTPDGANRVAITTGINNVFIGQRTGSSSAARSDSIAIGTYAMTTANNQLVIGGTADNAEFYGVNDVYIGQGVSLPATNFGQSSINIQTTGITAGQTDISAATSHLAWCSAVGTGTGIGGDIRFYSAPAGTTANTRNALFRQIDWRGDGRGVNFYQKSSPLAPSSSLTDGFIMYSNDHSGAGTATPFFRTEDGTIIDLALISVAGGGTGIASYAIGDILYASGATTLSKLADVTTGNVLLSGGVTTAPLYGKVGLTTHVSGVLPIANGGSNKALTLITGGVLWTDADSFEVSAAGTQNQVLISNVTAAPSWATMPITILVYATGNGTQVNLSTTTYGQFFFGSSNSTTETLRQIVIPFANGGTVRNLYVKTSGTQSATGAMTVTIRKNAGATALVATITAGAGSGTFTDLTHSFTVVQGDLLSIEFANAATAASTLVLSVQCEVDF